METRLGENLGIDSSSTENENIAGISAEIDEIDYIGENCEHLTGAQELKW